MPDLVGNLGYIKYYSWSSSRPVKNFSNSIRYNCQKICSWLRRSKAILEIRKKVKFLQVINNPIIYKLFKDFTEDRKKTNTAVFFLAANLSSAFLNTGTTDETSKNLENKTPIDTFWRVQLVCMKVWAHRSLEPPLKHSQDQTSLMNQGLLWPF